MASSRRPKASREEVKRKGLVFKFPFATEKKTYMFWDGTLGDAVPAKYTGTTTVNDLNVYKFQTEVPDTVVGTRDLPASVLGLPGTGNVTADTHYQDNTTMYVDPNTGAIVNRVENLKNWYAAEGKELITTEAELSYTKKEIAQTVDEVATKGKLLNAIHGIIPILAGRHRPDPAGAGDRAQHAQARHARGLASSRLHQLTEGLQDLLEALVAVLAPSGTQGQDRPVRQRHRTEGHARTATGHREERQLLDVGGVDATEVGDQQGGPESGSQHPQPRVDQPVTQRDASAGRRWAWPRGVPRPPRGPPRPGTVAPRCGSAASRCSPRS